MISPIPPWIYMHYDVFPVPIDKYSRILVNTTDPALNGLYEVSISAKLNLVPSYPSQDVITFPLILYADLCLLTNFND